MPSRAADRGRRASPSATAAGRRSPASASRLRAGERLALLGPNGGGKTTLLRAAARRAARRSPASLRGRRQLRHGPADRALAARLPGLARSTWRRWERSRACPGGGGPGRAERAAAREALERVGLGRARRGDLRRALRRPAPARADRPRARPGRPGAAARRALHRPRPRQRRAAGSADRRAGRRRGTGVVIATHDLEQARALGPRPLPQPPPDRLRPARPRCSTRRGAGGDLRRRDRRDPRRGRPGDPAPAPSPPLSMLEPLQEPFMQRALAEVVAARRSPAARSAAGSSSTGSPTRPSRSPTRSSPASSSPRSPACRCCSARRRRSSLAALAIAARRAARRGRAARPRVAVVVTTMFGLGVLLALSPDSPPGIEALLFGDILGVTDADLLAAAALVVARRRGAAAPARPPARRRLRPRRGPRARRLAGAAPTPPCWSCSAAAIVVAVQGLGNLLVVAVFVGPAARGAPAQRPDRADDGARRGARCARRRRRPLPLLLRRHRRRRLGGAGDRRRSTCSRCRSAGCARPPPGAAPAEATIG